MSILAIDTSTRTAFVAVASIERHPPIALATAVDDSGNHSDRLIAVVDECLRDAKLELAELEAIAIGAGPGSFTGLRIGMATAKGLALAAGVPLWTASSLCAVAASAAAPPAAEVIAAVVDGHRGEVFVGLFAAVSLEPIGTEHVLAPGDLARELHHRGIDPKVTLIAGEGAALYPEQIASVGALAVEPAVRPTALGVAAVAAAGSRRDVRATGTPTYIRPSEAEIRFPNGNPGGAFAAAPDPGKEPKRR